MVVSCKKKVENEIDKSTNFLDNITDTLPIIDNKTISLSENGSIVQNAEIPDNDTYLGDIEINDDNNTKNGKTDELKELYDAILFSDKDKAKLLLEKGVNLNQKNANNTFLSLAVIKSDIDMAKFLLENNADVNEPNSEGNTPLSLAIINKDDAMVDLLLNNELIDLYAVHNNSWLANPIYTSIHEGCTSCIHKFVNKGFDINYDFSKYGASPLLLYALDCKNNIYDEDFDKMIDALLTYNQNINVRGTDNKTALYKAIEEKEYSTSLKLLCLGANYNYSKDNVSIKQMINSIDENEYSKYKNDIKENFNIILSIINEKESIKNIKQCIDYKLFIENNSLLDNKTENK